MRRALFSLFLLFVSCLVLCACAEEEAETFDVYSRVIDVPTAGPIQYYAQNDSRWYRLIYEPHYADTRRYFGETGCGPTTAATAIARQVAPDDLPSLIAHAGYKFNGFPHCECSVSFHPCYYGNHVPVYPETPGDFLADLPIVFASYALGNNDHNRTPRTWEPGTHIQLFELLAGDYGLDYSSTRDFGEACDAIRRGASVITTVKRNPFAKNSHYLLLAGIDEESLYILDSDMRSRYPRDLKNQIEILEPGLVRVKLSDVPELRFYGFYIMEKRTAANPAPEAH